MMFFPSLSLGLVSLGLFGAPLAASPAPAASFRVVDVYVDSGSNALAAYQLEVAAVPATARIAGIEGGAHPVFQEPPFYDPRAIQQERVILAAYSTAPAAELPRGKTRVATIHFQFPGEKSPRFEVALRVAGDAQGRSIAVTVAVEERNTP